MLGAKAKQISSLAQFDGRAVIVRLWSETRGLPRQRLICTTFSFLNIKGCLEANASFLRRAPRLGLLKNLLGFVA